MKFTKYIASCMAAMTLLAAATSCQDDYTAPSLEVPVADMKPNTTILDLKKSFQEYQEATGQTTLRITDKTIIHGFVVSSDATGNIYQSLVIQDNTAAIQFSISRASLWSLYPVGQEIVVDVTGFVVGTYGKLIQIGDYYESGGSAQVGRMLYAKFKNQSQLNGLPNDNFKYVAFDAEWPADRPYVIATSIEEANEMVGNNDDVLRMQSQLVRFQNVHWQDAGETTYAEYEETSRRYILDVDGNSLMAYNSGYSTFYNQTLPEGTGAVEGILSYYTFDNSTDSPWQLLLRSTEDVQFGDVPGSREHPYGVDDIIALDNCGLNAWAEGYIVGAFDFNGNAVFGANDDLLDDNLLIATAADVKDVGQCVCVELPAGSKLRKLANLLDNPDRLGHKLTVNGSFASYYNMHGIRVSNGSLANFTIGGVDLGPNEGSGASDDPYIVEFLINNFSEDFTDVWITGYIVGYYDGNKGIVLGPLEDTYNYNGPNVIIASSPDCTDPAMCAYMKVDRNTVGLVKNPDNYGKEFNAKGNFTTLQNLPAFDAKEVKFL